jgi:hypothetical protein
MKNLLVSLVAVLISQTAFAVPVQIGRQDIKFPTQQMVEKQTFTNPAVADTVAVGSALAGPTSAAQTTATTGLTSPDVPRNVVITVGGVGADQEACTMRVVGTNYFGNSMTEEFYIPAHKSGSVTGVLAFKTVTSVVWDANCEDGAFGATWYIGIGEKLGLKRCVDSAGHFLFSTLNGAKEATAPTLAVGTSVQGNTSDFNGTMNGANDFELFFFQNFTCF